MWQLQHLLEYNHYDNYVISTTTDDMDPKDNQDYLVVLTSAASKDTYYFNTSWRLLSFYHSVIITEGKGPSVVIRTPENFVK